MQIARPGLQHGQQPDLRAEILVIACDVDERISRFAQEQSVEEFLIGANELPQLFRHGEGDEIIWDGQQAAALVMQPFGGVGVAALRTGPMIARMVNQFAPSAAAAKELRAQGRGAAGQDGLDGAPMRRQQARAKLPFIRRPVATQDFGQSDQEDQPLDF